MTEIFNGSPEALPSPASRRYEIFGDDPEAIVQNPSYKLLDQNLSVLYSLTSGREYGEVIITGDGYEITFRNSDLTIINPNGSELSIFFEGENMVIVKINGADLGTFMRQTENFDASVHNAEGVIVALSRAAELITAAETNDVMTDLNAF